MRTKEELQSPEFCDSMFELQEALDNAGIHYILKRHRGANPELLNVLGYYPTGEWQIFIEDGAERISIIRGMASFGLYEAYGGKFEDPERFQTAAELVKTLKHI